MKLGGTTQKTTRKLTPKQSAILQYLKVHPLAGRGEIVQHISEITEDGVIYNLKRLQDMGLLKRVGPARGGRWEVVEEYCNPVSVVKI